MEQVTRDQARTGIETSEQRRQRACVRRPPNGHLRRRFFCASVGSVVVIKTSSTLEIDAATAARLGVEPVFTESRYVLTFVDHNEMHYRGRRENGPGAAAGE
ncbi:MAG: hypothetical protein COW42_14920, partial [Deltaproteobacteria bacterium CG17_big_fil_post_rev_8_21_14_2_50_63_7]